MRVQVRINTASLPTLDNLNALHDVRRDGDLGEAERLGYIAHRFLMLGECIRVHEDNGEAGNVTGFF